MRCRKARWFLSAQCDGTLSERARLRLEEHLKVCADCRRESFYFSEIAALAGRLEKSNVRPDFNLRLRAAIRRSEAAPTQRKSWREFSSQIFLRPVLAFGLLIFALGGGVTGYVLIQEDSAQPLLSVDKAGPGEWQSEILPGLTPVNGESDEDLRVRQYLEVQRGESEYLIQTVSLPEQQTQEKMQQYVMPVIPAEQMVRQVSY